jgi:hypothetical protein
VDGCSSPVLFKWRWEEARIIALIRGGGMKEEEERMIIFCRGFRAPKCAKFALDGHRGSRAAGQRRLENCGWDGSHKYPDTNKKLITLMEWGRAEGVKRIGEERRMRQRVLNAAEDGNG